MIKLLPLLLLPLCTFAQYKGVSYQLHNEVGTFALTSLTFSHRIDNEEGFSFVTDRSGKDTLYHFDGFLNGYVGLSNDGRTIVQLRSEKNAAPLEKSILTFYVLGKEYGSVTLDRLIRYELDEAIERGTLPTSGWLRNDSLLNKMASNAFYMTDDKVFISSDGPILHVYDMNGMFLIYTGNGANHFMQNYYSIPDLPFRTEFTSSAYFPKGFPKVNNGKNIPDILCHILNTSVSIPEEATFRVELELLLSQDGKKDLRKAVVYGTLTNEPDILKSEQLKNGLEKMEFDTSLIPPSHPSWIFFSGGIWMK